MFRKRVVLSFRSEIRPLRKWPWLTERFVRWVVRRCDVVLCQSPLAAEKLVELYRCDRRRIAVVPNWIDAGPYLPLARARQERGGFSTPPVVLYMGWLEAFKGIFTLLTALGRLAEAGRAVRVVYCGSGGDRQRLAERIDDAGLQDRVELRGWVDGEAKMAAYGEADLFVLPSEREGLPNALLEAMAAGLPVVATPVGGIPSVVEPGIHGLLVPPDDPEKLAQAVADILDDPARAREMGRSGHEKIMADHDMSRLWPRLLKTLWPRAGDPADRQL
jgi:glycosyltransferase involved in cell wall biosynthesis